MQKITVNIKGMHCHSCELMIEDELKKIPQIAKATVAHKNGVAEIYFKHDPPPPAEIEKAIRAAGYEIGLHDQPWLSKKTSDYTDFIISASILAIIYLAAAWTGLAKISLFSTGNYGNLGVVFLIGLTAGISSCMALVGGLVLGAASRFAEKHPDATASQKFRPHLFFSFGRIISYFILGGLIGLIGQTLKLSSSALGGLTIIAGVTMLFIGIQLIEIFPKISRFSPTIPKSVSRFLRIKTRAAKAYSHANSIILGALTFFLPCGFTQAMQIFAISSGSFVTGALTMGIFALGTTPGLLGIGGLTSVLKGSAGKKFFKFIGVVVIALALLNINSGINLTGINISLPSTSSKTQNPETPAVTGGVQTVHMDQAYNGYSPNKFTVKKDIPVKWIINSKDDYSCASSIIMPKYDITKTLDRGENIITFTPTETGTIKFTCSMGMYSGTFDVI
jgi:uncharacterized protein